MTRKNSLVLVRTLTYRHEVVRILLLSCFYPFRHLMLFVVCFLPRSTHLYLLFPNRACTHPAGFIILYAFTPPMQFIRAPSPLVISAHHSSCYQFKFEDTSTAALIYSESP